MKNSFCSVSWIKSLFVNRSIKVNCFSLDNGLSVSIRRHHRGSTHRSLHHHRLPLHGLLDHYRLHLHLNLRHHHLLLHHWLLLHGHHGWMLHLSHLHLRLTGNMGNRLVSTLFGCLRIFSTMVLSDICLSIGFSPLFAAAYACNTNTERDASSEDD